MTFESSRYREWLKHQKAPEELIAESSQAIADYDTIAASPKDTATPLERLSTAAMHSRFVVWDVALALLSRLAATLPAARDHILKMSHSSRLQIRQRSMLYIGGLPSDFCAELVGRLLSDRSAKVRSYAATKIECLDLTQLVPNLDGAADKETDAQAQEIMQLNASLMRQGYVEYNEPFYSISVRVSPGYRTSIRYFRGELLTSESVQRIGVSKIRKSLSDSAVARANRRTNEGA